MSAGANLPSSEWATTSTLLERLASSEDSMAWGRLSGRFREPVFRFARRLGLSSADAEDVVQESLLALVQGMQAGRYSRGQGRLSHWLFGIAFRKAQDLRRKNARRERRVTTGPPQMLELADLPDEAACTSIWDDEWERQVLDQCLLQARSEVETTTFHAFELTVLQGLPPSDVAEALGVPVRTVYNAKHRLLKRVRELREEWEATDEFP